MGKKQHFVPQLYLKNFSDISRKSIGTYRFEEQQFIQNASIKDIAYRNHLYDDDDSIEVFLANEEGIWKNVIDVFLSHPGVRSFFAINWKLSASLYKNNGEFTMTQ